MVNTSVNDSTKGFPRQARHQPFYTRPLVLWGGVWVTLLVVGAVAAKGLLSAGPVEEKPESELMAQDAAEPAMPDTSSTPAQIQQTPSTLPTFTRVPELLPEPSPKPPKVAQKPAGVPLWLYGAIAFGCTAGSVLISLGFKRATPPRKPAKRGKTKPQPVPTAKVRKPQQRSAPKRRPVSPTARERSPIPAEPAFIVEPMVTVLPPEESHPLDWDEATLADMMDLRKRQSLASLLRK